MKYLKPAKLKRGDTIAIISPSWGGPSVFPHIYENGLKVLNERFGLKIKEYPTARTSADKLYNNPKSRAKDINDAFADKEVKAIITSIGGDDGIRVLKYLNKTIIKKNPKIFMGYSDATNFNTYLNQLGIISFNGPAIMSGFSQMKNFPDAINHINDILFKDSKEYEYKPYKEWSMKYLGWSKIENVGKVEEKKINSGWHWIQGNSIVAGELFGGCIEIITGLRGTKYWPKPAFLKGKILFFETSEDKPTPESVKYEMRNWGIQGIFDKIKGIMIGRTRDYTEEETKRLENYVLDIVGKEFNHPEIPIVSNMDFGHTEPQIILPLGIKVEINCKNKIIKLKESATK